MSGKGKEKSEEDKKLEKERLKKDLEDLKNRITIQIKKKEEEEEEIKEKL